MSTRTRERLRDAAFRVPGAGAWWMERRRRQFLAEYRERRDRYAAIAEERGLVHRNEDAPARTRARLAARGCTPRPRPRGQIHTFAFIPRISWHSALYGDLPELGPVSEYDYAAHGYTWQEFWDGAAGRRSRMCAEALAALREAHARRPVDWVFVYASGVEVEAGFIRKIVETVGAPVVNMCLDDKQSWTGRRIGGQRIGQVEIAPCFDLSWTSARVACEWYLVEGANPVYLPEGFDPTTFRPMDLPRDIPVSFIGGAYGFRPAVVDTLRRAGIPLQVFGPGWGTRQVWGEEQIEVLNRSVVNLGMGGINYAEDLTNVKTRDFEIPGTGGGAYLTSFNPDLALHFDLPREIACYRNLDEMVELVRHYLARPDEALEVARRGRERCLAEHRWLHRYEEVCRILGVLDDGAPAAPRHPQAAAAAGA